MVHGPMVHSVRENGEALMASCQAMLFRLDAGSTRKLRPYPSPDNDCVPGVANTPKVYAWETSSRIHGLPGIRVVASYHHPRTPGQLDRVPTRREWRRCTSLKHTTTAKGTQTSQSRRRCSPQPDGSTTPIQTRVSKGRYTQHPRPAARVHASAT